MLKSKGDYEGMIIAAIHATNSDDIIIIIKYIQSHYTVPTNFEKVCTQYRQLSIDNLNKTTQIHKYITHIHIRKP